MPLFYPVKKAVDLWSSSRARLLQTWDNLKTSFWFVPTIMAMATLVLSLVTLSLDQWVTIKRTGMLGWLFAGDPQSVSALLTTIIGSIISVFSVVFSVTIVSLTLAAGQFGPRVLRNFMRDRGTQIVLGVFISTFLYSLLALQQVKQAHEHASVPHVSVFTSLILVIISLGTLIYFIHHVAESIQAPNVITRVSAALGQAIDRFYPDSIDSADARSQDHLDGQVAQRLKTEGRDVCSNTEGYVQAIDEEHLLSVAHEHQMVFQLHCRAGYFVVPGFRLARIYPDRDLPDEVIENVRNAIVLGDRRTDTQDVEFAVHQLVEVALRALSPGINDPFTAHSCIDRLGAALTRLSQRRMRGPVLSDDQGQPRVILVTSDFAGIVNSVFNQIRQAGRTHPSVVIRLLEVITIIASQSRTDPQHAALRRQADMIHRDAMATVPVQEDRDDISQRYEQAVRTLRHAPADQISNSLHV